MRYWARLCAVVVVLALTLIGCSRVVDGVAQPDPRGPGVAVSEDGHGIVVGFADAPVQVEIYTEPQCEHCAHFQATFGEDIRAQIQSGRLAVVYRLLTFFDDEYGTDYSALASNSLFLAVAPATSAPTFQSFVETLWANQDLAFEDYSTDDFAILARQSGVDADLVARISDGDQGVDVTEMADANSRSLSELSIGESGTPTVYDLNREEILDISDPDWLSLLMRPV